MEAPRTPPQGVCSCLPSRVKLLVVSPLDGADGWLADALGADSATRIELHEARDEASAVVRLRDEVFDAVLAVHRPPEQDAFAFVEGLRVGGGLQPVVVLGETPSNEADALAYEAGADEYCSIGESSLRGLLWKIGKAIERSRLVRENRRLLQADRQRLQHEHHETENLLKRQRALLADIEVLRQEDGGAAPSEAGPLGARLREAASGEPKQEPLPTAIAERYDEILRAYVMMGSGRLAEELAEVAHELIDVGSSARQAIGLHLEVLERLVEGLGNRSARHVMNRADLLVVEVLGLLADGYRRRYHAGGGSRHRLPSGFEPAGCDLTQIAPQDADAA